MKFRGYRSQKIRKNIRVIRLQENPAAALKPPAEDMKERAPPQFHLDFLGENAATERKASTKTDVCFAGVSYSNLARSAAGKIVESCGFFSAISPKPVDERISSQKPKSYAMRC